MADHSWKIYGQIAIKKLDKTAFLYNSTRIPKDMRSFFHVNFIDIGKKVEIVLELNNSDQYMATFLRPEKQATRINLSWQSDFSLFLRTRHPEESAEFLTNGSCKHPPFLSFTWKSFDPPILLVDTVSQEYEIGDSQRQPDSDNEIFNGRREGAIRYLISKSYERDAKNRKRAIQIHGLHCKVCGFDFEEQYGLVGKDYIHIHHIEPLYMLEGEQKVINPEIDLIPICANCHQMIHRNRKQALSIEYLRSQIKYPYVEKKTPQL